MDFAQRERINYDEPEAFEHEALRADLEALREGRSITRKGYDYKLHRRCDSQERICPADVVLLAVSYTHLPSPTPRPPISPSSTRRTLSARNCAAP